MDFPLSRLDWLALLLQTRRHGIAMRMLATVFVVRTCETGLAHGPSYTFDFSSPVIRFERPRL
jgi:hypothetical protein